MTDEPLDGSEDSVRGDPTTKAFAQALGALVVRQMSRQREAASPREIRLTWHDVGGGGVSVEVSRRGSAPPVPSRRPRFLLVEDHDLGARAVARLLSRFGEVRVAATIAEAQSLLTDPGPWAGLLIDVRLPDGDGLDIVAQVREQDARVPILVMTGGDDRRGTNRAQSLDAEFAFKPLDDTNLLHFAERACARLLVDDRAVAAVITHRARESGLTPREVEVLSLVVASDGSPRTSAAEALGVSENTAKVHIAAILRKTGHGRLADLVQSILREAWVTNRSDGIA